MDRGIHHSFFRAFVKESEATAIYDFDLACVSAFKHHEREHHSPFLPHSASFFGIYDIFHDGFTNVVVVAPAVNPTSTSGPDAGHTQGKTVAGSFSARSAALARAVPGTRPFLPALTGLLPMYGRVSRQVRESGRD
jgi:hypothetical protein